MPEELVRDMRDLLYLLDSSCSLRRKRVGAEGTGRRAPELMGNSARHFGGMLMANIADRKVAVLATDGFEEVELTVARQGAARRRRGGDDRLP